MSAFSTISEYYAHIVHIFAQSGCSDDFRVIKFRADGKNKGYVSGEPLGFKKDEASFRFYEEVVIEDDGGLRRPSYSYHYECVDEDGHPFFFRYDRDPNSAEALVHEECHLHVNRKVPRFKTHETCFEEVFRFIAAQFYGVVPE